LPGGQTPFVEALSARYPWLLVHSRDLSSEQEAVKAYVAMAAALSQEASSVPAFIFCGRMEVGFDRPEGTGRALEDGLQLVSRNAGMPARRRRLCCGKWLQAPPECRFASLLGRVTAEQLSLPVFTLIIAGLDAFNPCAFFVLLFLLSLLVHAGSRATHAVHRRRLPVLLRPDLLPVHGRLAQRVPLAGRDRAGHDRWQGGWR
jgi:hypothetical protein